MPRKTKLPRKLRNAPVSNVTFQDKIAQDIKSFDKLNKTLTQLKETSLTSTKYLMKIVSLMTKKKKTLRRAVPERDASGKFVKKATTIAAEKLKVDTADSIEAGFKNVSKSLEAGFSKLAKDLAIPLIKNKIDKTTAADFENALEKEQKDSQRWDLLFRLDKERNDLLRSILGISRRGGRRGDEADGFASGRSSRFADAAIAGLSGAAAARLLRRRAAAATAKPLLQRIAQKARIGARSILDIAKPFTRPIVNRARELATAASTRISESYVGRTAAQIPEIVRSTARAVPGLISGAGEIVKKTAEQVAPKTASFLGNVAEKIGRFGARAGSIIADYGGSFLQKLVDSKTFLVKAIKRFGGIKAVAKMLKIPVISTLIEGLLLNWEVKKILKDPNSSEEEKKRLIGKAVVKSIAGTGGALAGGLVGTAFGGPVGAIAGAVGGDVVGRVLADSILDVVPGAGFLGGLVANTFGLNLTPEKMKETQPGVIMERQEDFDGAPKPEIERSKNLRRNATGVMPQDSENSGNMDSISSPSTREKIRIERSNPTSSIQLRQKIEEVQELQANSNKPIVIPIMQQSQKQVSQQPSSDTKILVPVSTVNRDMSLLQKPSLVL